MSYFVRQLAEVDANAGLRQTINVGGQTPLEKSEEFFTQKDVMETPWIIYALIIALAYYLYGTFFKS